MQAHCVMHTNVQCCSVCVCVCEKRYSCQHLSGVRAVYSHFPTTGHFVPFSIITVYPFVVLGVIFTSYLSYLFIYLFIFKSVVVLVNFFVVINILLLFIEHSNQELVLRISRMRNMPANLSVPACISDSCALLNNDVTFVAMEPFSPCYVSPLHSESQIIT